MTDDRDWALSALTTLTEDCTDVIHKEARLWEEPAYTQTDDVTSANLTTARPLTTTPNPTPTRGEQLLLDVCPSDCSRHGECRNGKCVCAPEYTGADCSTARYAPPKV